MKKSLIAVACTALLALPVLAAPYIVVLKDGTRYAAKAKWTVVNGKAIVRLENGQSLQLDPALIDVPRSEEMTKVGLATANIIDLGTGTSGGPGSPQPKKPSLGDTIRLRRQTPAETAPAPAPAPTPAVVPTSGAGITTQVTSKFERAFENIGIFEHKVSPTGQRSLRAEMTVDTEERVFNAISATSFLMVRNAGVEGVQIDMVELFMKTTTGGAAGRFQMSRADAEALDKRAITQQDYFIRNVIY